jgi:hypoxanthine phosphoribosyltransferase
MLFSDLCDSTSTLTKNYKEGLSRLKLHEKWCKAAGAARTKGLGDGFMLEFKDAVRACRAAFDLLEKASEKNIDLKVTIARGSFYPDRGSQKWNGILPAKSARISQFARKNEIWIDGETRDALAGYFEVLNAKADCLESPQSAAFRVKLRGFSNADFTIHQLRQIGTKCGLSDDARAKEWILLWSDVETWIKSVVDHAHREKIKPRWVVGIGRSGAILGGMIAGNLKFKIRKDHIPVTTIERVHRKNNYVLSTLTDREEEFTSDGNPVVTGRKLPSKKQTVLIVIGEAKSGGSVACVKHWLASRGFNQSVVAALLASKKGIADFEPYLYGQSAMMPWQLVPGYDKDWEPYRDMISMKY